MNVGEIQAVVKLSDEVSGQLEEACRRMEAAASEVRPRGSVPLALLGAAAAATQLSRPVSRRRLLFRWVRG